MNVRSLQKRIYSELQKNGDKKRVEEDRIYHKYKHHNSFGIPSPVLEKVLRQFKKEITALECDDVILLAQLLISKEIEESVLAGNFVLQNRLGCLGPSKLNFLDQMLDHFCSWSTVDDFCMDVLQPILSEYPTQTLALLKKWNKSKNMWERRASVVVFTRKIGESGKYTDEAIELCSNLLNDQEDLVQKGVGWCLKDAMRGDKNKVLSYIKKIRKQGVPSTITLYAIRDLKGKERQSVLSIK